MDYWSDLLQLAVKLPANSAQYNFIIFIATTNNK